MTLKKVSLIIALIFAAYSFGANATFAADKLVFAAGSHHDSSEQQIYSVNSDGTNFVQLTDLAGKRKAATWIDSGTRIVFESTYENLGGVSRLYVMDADGSNIEPLVSAEVWTGAVYAASTGTPAIPFTFRVLHPWYKW